ncbi:MAG: sugar ABC transporter permease, partial [Eubacteriales bacterium]
IQGFANYTRLLQDELVIGSIKNTLQFSLLSVPLGIIVALVLANILTQNIRGVGVYRVLYFLPMIAAPAAVTMVWRMIYNGQYGIINGILANFGIAGPSWMSDPNLAMWSVIVIAAWSGLGQQIIILIAAIKGVSKTYYEAAAIDGAHGWHLFMNITLPMVSPSVFFLTVTGIINALRQFDIVYMMYYNTTNPAIDSVRTLMYEYYRQAFQANDKAYASAIVIFSFVIIMMFTGIQFIGQRKWVHYE